MMRVEGLRSEMDKLQRIREERHRKKLGVCQWRGTPFIPVPWAVGNCCEIRLRCQR